MIDYQNMSFDELLREGGYDDGCGRIHSCGLKYLRIGRDAVKTLPECFARLGFHKAFVVADPNTEKAAWGKIKAVLDAANLPYTYFRFYQTHPNPDEASVGGVVMAFDRSCDVILAVGSGVINDCCKVVAKATGIPSIVVATAPSMDGYASDGASMIKNGVKINASVPCPLAIIADTLIMKDAPARMLWSGLGDMLAKYVALGEWRISHVINGEYYCADVARLMRASLDKLVNAAPRLMDRNPETIGAITEGLIMSGIAMAFVKVSRPASGLEHYFSHLWEMMAMNGRIPWDTHGIQVGVGTYLTLCIYDKIRTLSPSRAVAEKAMQDFDPAQWEKEVRRVFGSAAPAILDLEKKAKKNNPAGQKKRLNAILTHWEEIQQIIREEFPQTADVKKLMEQVGMPIVPSDIGYDDSAAYDAFIYSRDIRDKYLTSSMLWDLGLLYTTKLQLTR